MSYVIAKIYNLFSLPITLNRKQAKEFIICMWGTIARQKLLLKGRKLAIPFFIIWLSNKNASLNTTIFESHHQFPYIFFYQRT